VVFSVVLAGAFEAVEAGALPAVEAGYRRPLVSYKDTASDTRAQTLGAITDVKAEKLHEYASLAYGDQDSRHDPGGTKVGEADGGERARSRCVMNHWVAFIYGGL
jgi:hypothetical protein